jgi:hypothetical protein
LDDPRNHTRTMAPSMSTARLTAPAVMDARRTNPSDVRARENTAGLQSADGVS